MDVVDQLRHLALMREGGVVNVAGLAKNCRTVLRDARRSRGLTQEQLGRLCGYSAASISRFETGARPLTDIGTLAAFARVLAIPPALFGLDPVGLTSIAATACNARVGVVPGRRSSGPASLCENGPDDGGDEDKMRRRDMLAAMGLVALPGTSTTTVRPDAVAASVRGLGSMLHGPPRSAQSLPLADVGRVVAAAQQAFDACRYHELASVLPNVVALAEASYAQAPESTSRQFADGVSRAYLLGSELCVKLGEDGMAWVAADRAVNAAVAGVDPAVRAAAVRSVAIAMRRHGHHDSAISLLTRSAEEFGTSWGTPSSGQLAAYASLLCTAAYSSAQNGARDLALDLISDAARAADRTTAEGPPGRTAFGPANVAVYQIGVHTALGQPALAVKHARSIDPASLPTAERRSRLFVDTARAWQQYGRADRAFLALRAAERQASEELTRPAVRGMIATLLSTAGPTPDGLRAMAARTGADV